MAARPIQSLAKARAVIEVLTDRGPLTPAQVADAIGAPRSSTYRLIDGLREVDLVSNGTGARVRLSQRWMTLADASRVARPEWRAGRAVLATLSDETGLTAQLSVRRGDEAACVEWSPGRGVELLSLRPGTAHALNAGAAGRVLRAYADDRTQITARAYTPQTLTGSEELEQDRNEILIRSNVVAIGDIKPGIATVAVPVFGPRSQVIAAISLTGITEDVHVRLAGALPRLREAARELRAASLSTPVVD